MDTLGYVVWDVEFVASRARGAGAKRTCTVRFTLVTGSPMTTGLTTGTGMTTGSGGAHWNVIKPGSVDLLDADTDISKRVAQHMA